jgi:hypothetical protein
MMGATLEARRHTRKNLSVRECKLEQEYEKCAGAEDAADRMKSARVLQEVPRFEDHAPVYALSQR